ncbi:MAG: TetR family transcriptional regulator [Alphaproteobacteria bacterium]|nr:TetR family transcriptional regulator [Alphaproteobacteria bacterium]MCB9696606.1 TetR family transcriptional regulator [Alphaproteobacteria bacterium]
MDRREQLVSALARLAARDGHLDAPVAEIARAAGLTPGLVHYYFPRKLDLVLAVVEQLTGVLTRRLAGRTDLEGLLEACLGRGEDERPDAVRAWVAVGAAAVKDPEIRVAWTAAMRSLGAALGAASGDDPERAAAAVAMVLGFWQIGAVDPEGLEPGIALRAATAVLR